MGKPYKILLCLYSGQKMEWYFEDLRESLKWLYTITGAETCKDAISLAWFEVETEEEKKKLGLLRDFYLGQFDGKLQPSINFEELYAEVISEIEGG